MSIFSQTKLGVALLLLRFSKAQIFSLATRFQTHQYMLFPCTEETQFTFTKKINKKKLIILPAGLGTANYI